MTMTMAWPFVKVAAALGFGLNAAGLLASLNMLIMTEGGFDFSAAECIAWMEEAGFHNISTKTLTDEQSMVVGYR